MCNCNSLRRFNRIPDEMAAYLRNYDFNISQKACEFAIGYMASKGRSGNPEPIDNPYDKKGCEDLLKKHGIKLERDKFWNAVWVLNMKMADCWGSSIEDERHLALAVKDVIDDVDATPRDIFDMWMMKLENKGVPIPWCDLI